MKGLFQCPPRAAPWVIMDASLSPCKGKSFQIAECSKSSAKIAKKKQIKQGCFKQSCLKPSFFAETAILHLIKT